ncbi:class I SAM-dependent methyltransferase [Piscinibacter terrae]|uniref:Methyltransferase domain-containing protein n=1 Tax=Piscinibacter terrae TaxID=2496871 RepID=A0A3N7HQC5_9BURK|nr:class I SAM-dependent methyltransferase [Albitalea terrae]RQP24427.1 methyltransferase domain-containing protein [Albitalea terrae]
MNTTLDAPKTAARDQWDRAAPGWDRHTPVIRQWLRTATDTMLNMAGVAPGASVLDVAAGAGDQTLDIARRVGTEGSVLATDFSPAILALAQQRAHDAGFAQVRTLVADGEHLPDGLGPFDAAVCRLGLMLFADPLQGLREMHRVLRPGGGICTMVFSRPEKNPCVALLMQTALQHAGMPARSPFQPGGLMSLGQPGLIDGLFEQAGLRQVATTAIEAPFRLPTARHYLDFVRASASPIQQILSRLDVAAQDAAWQDMEARLHAFDTADGWVGPNELLLTAARR